MFVFSQLQPIRNVHALQKHSSDRQRPQQHLFISVFLIPDSYRLSGQRPADVFDLCLVIMSAPAPSLTFIGSSPPSIMGHL